MNDRIERLRRRLRSLGVANFLVTRLSNIRYLCGFTGSNALLLVSGKAAYFITDGRYTNQAAEQVKGASVSIYSGGKSISDAFIRELKSNKAIRFRGRIGIENTVMTVEMYQALRAAFPNSDLIETTDVVDNLGMIKDSAEIDAIRKAVSITDKTFKHILPLIKPGVSEMDLSAEISYYNKKLGAEKDGFDNIVASGPRSALPHGIATSRKIHKGELVTFDIGCVYDGYPSDMTRTVVVGKANAKQRKIYGIVREAQARAAEAVKAGVKCSAVDAVARRIITRAGYGKEFSHSLGHGLGLWDRVKQVHARPVLSKVAKGRLEAGMVVTIEPGIYIDGFGGVRIEDDVVVTENGHKALNKSTKILLEL